MNAKTPHPIVGAAFRFARRQLFAKMCEANVKIFLGSLCGVAVLAIVTSVSAQTAETLTSNPVFEKNCAKCHGKTAEGRHFGGPSLVSEDVRKTSVEELRNVITNGKHRMPKYSGKLTPEEIDSLVSQIKAATKE